MADASDHFKYADVGGRTVPVDWVPVVAGPDPLPKPLRYLRADTVCTVTVTTPGSMAEDPVATRDLKFIAGETRAGMFLSVTVVSAGAVEGGI